CGSLRAIQIEPKQHVIGIRTLRSAILAARSRREGGIQVGTELDYVGQPVALQSAQRDRVVAGLQDDTAPAAAGLAVQPLVPFGSDIGSDRLLTIGIERSRGSVPGKRFDDPLKRVVD